MKGSWECSKRLIVDIICRLWDFRFPRLIFRILFVWCPLHRLRFFLVFLLGIIQDKAYKVSQDLSFTVPIFHFRISSGTGFFATCLTWSLDPFFLAVFSDILHSLMQVYISICAFSIYKKSTVHYVHLVLVNQLVVFVKVYRIFFPDFKDFNLRRQQASERY